MPERRPTVLGHARRPRGIGRLGRTTLPVVLALVAAYLVARGLLVASLADVFLYLDEAVKGAEAKAILEVRPVQHHLLAAFPYEGGSFVASHLKAGLFALIGESLLAHKLLALSWGVLILLAGMRLARAHLEPGADVLFAVLLVLAPGHLQKLSLLHVGNHWEASLFVLLALDQGLRVAVDGERTARRLAAFGLLFGFGAYFSFQVVALVVPVVVAAALRLRGEAFRRGAAAWTAGFLLGSAPWWSMWLAFGDRMLDIHGLSLVERRNNAAALLRLVESLWSGRSPREVLSVFLLPILAGVVCAWNTRSRGGRWSSASRLLALCLALWALNWVTSAFVLAPVYHYSVLSRLSTPGVVALLLVASAGAQALRRRAEPASRALVAGVLALVLLGAADAWAACRAGEPATPRANLGLLARTKGVAYAPYMTHLLGKLDGPQDERVALLLSFEEDRDLLLPEVCAALFSDGRAELDEVLALARPLEADDRARFLRGLGSWLAARSGADRERAWSLIADVEDDELAGLLREAMGRFDASWAASEGRLEDDAAWVAGREGREDYLRGLGWRLAWGLVLSPYGGPAWILRPDRARALIERQPAALRGPLRAGFEEAWSLSQL